MPTIATRRAETRTRTIAAPPDAVFAVIADGARLPEWAPAFASAAELIGGERWLVGVGEDRFPILVRADAGARTADYVSPDDLARGAFLRVLPNRDGAELLFTLFFGDGVEEAAIDAQMATVDTELEAVARLVES